MSTIHEQNTPVISSPLIHFLHRYPAGHLYAYSFLHYFTNAGQSLKRAQWLFGAIYVATLALVFSIYSTSKRVSLLLPSRTTSLSVLTALLSRTDTALRSHLSHPFETDSLALRLAVIQRLPRNVFPVCGTVVLPR